MKKLLFLFFATILFASCSNDNDEPATTGKTYKVTFNVSNFDIDTKPMKADNGLGLGLYYTIYEKESGKAIKSKYQYGTEDGQIVEEVPAGSYYIAFIASARVISFGEGSSNIPPVDRDSTYLFGYNFYTDYCYGANYIAYPALRKYRIFYEKAEFTVGVGNEEVNKDVELQPKWSEVTINVTDAETCTLPEGTNTIDCIVSPDFYGFSIADGSTTKFGEGGFIHPVQSTSANSDIGFRTMKGLSHIYIAASKNATVKLVFIRQYDAGTDILGERVIYKGDLEGGKNITLRGTLGKTTSTGTFNVSLADLTDGGVIPFN